MTKYSVIFSVILCGKNPKEIVFHPSDWGHLGHCMMREKFNILRALRTKKSEAQK